MNKASTDSEETMNIGQASDDSTRTDEERPGGRGGKLEMKQEQQPVTSGHQDPKQRRLYLILLTFSICTALLGLILLIIWMFKYRPVTGVGLTNAGQLSNLHPLMMYTFMVSLNMYSVLIYRTHYSQPKNRLKWTHAILSGGNIVMSILGVAAMFAAHLKAGIPNLYSLHSWIGGTTNIFYISQFILGFVAFMRPGLAQHRRAMIMPWHRICGAAILILAALAAITGIAELVIFQDKEGAYSKFTPITFIANFAGVCVILMTATTIYLLRAPEYLRLRLVEEQPLKR